MKLLSISKTRNIAVQFLVLLLALIFGPFALAQDPILVEDINPGISSQVGIQPRQFLEVNGKVVFPGFEGMWATDGTTIGTELIYPIGIYYTGQMFTQSGKVIFPGIESSTGMELWQTDGTAEGTHIISDLNPGPRGSVEQNQTPVTLAGRTFIRLSDGINGFEPWVTDGSEEGTRMIRDINPGSGNSGSKGFVQFNNEIYFYAYNGVNWGLWKTTSEGTDAQLIRSFPYINALVASQDLLFIVVDSQHIWISDGTSVGTTYLKNMGRSISWIREFNGRAVFNVYYDGVWITDGTLNGTQKLSADSSDGPFMQYGNILLFGGGSTYNRELWRSDGTPLGTYQLKDINPSGSSSPGLFLEFNGFVYFLASESVHGREIWRTDGTASGTVLAIEFISGLGSGQVGRLTNAM